jgi:hypothetical protein
MESSWSVVAAIGATVGVVIMVLGLRKKEQKPLAVESIDGVLKQDWTRTGNIDFHAASLESTAPPILILRVEERKITETAMAQDVVELRWRSASLTEAKEVVACWNARSELKVPDNLLNLPKRPTPKN